VPPNDETATSGRGSRFAARFLAAAAAGNAAFSMIDLVMRFSATSPIE
jgi:hypothetical protein